MSEPKSGRGSLIAGGVAAVLASACCLGPLVLIALGVSGAWIGNLAALEPYRPWFIGAALVAMVFAWRRIYRPAQDCQPGDVCAVPQVRTTYKTCTATRRSTVTSASFASPRKSATWLASSATS